MVPYHSGNIGGPHIPIKNLADADADADASADSDSPSLLAKEADDDSITVQKRKKERISLYSHIFLNVVPSTCTYACTYYYHIVVSNVLAFNINNIVINHNATLYSSNMKGYEINFYIQMRYIKCATSFLLIYIVN